MSLFAFILIFASALLHATLHLVVKKNRITLPYYAMISSASALIWLHAQFWTPVEFQLLPREFWELMLLSVLADILYGIGLIACYRCMEMTTAYPLMRTLPILLTVLVTSLAGWGAPLSGAAKVGFGIVFIGAMLMPLFHFRDFSLKNYCSRNIVFVILAACGTTGYTVFDSGCLRIMKVCFPEVALMIRSITYQSTRALVLSGVLWLCIFLNRSRRAELSALCRSRDFTPLLSGCIASMTYILVLSSMNFVTNVSYVQVFRQISLPIGMLAGVLILKEHCTAPKFLGVVLILLGLTISSFC